MSLDRWDVTVTYEAGPASHQFYLNAKGNKVAGTHKGWAFEGDLRGTIEDATVAFQSSLAGRAQTLNFGFSGKVAGDTMAGDVTLGEYGRAKFDGEAARDGVESTGREACRTSVGRPVAREA